jgi:ABC-type sulfate/molybdate transport systems ATPase subunit
VLEARIEKRRGAFIVDVALRVDDTEPLGLFGASGAGKSTILACIAGAEMPDAGRVTLDGELFFPPSRPLHHRSIGYLTQDANLFPHLSVADNVAFGLRNGARDEHAAWTAQLRDRLDLGSIWHAPAYAISGGQARRVALARMLARKPRLVLLDEPFTGLDRDLVRELIAALIDWRRELRFITLIVDHDAEILQRLCPRAVVIEQGRVVQHDAWDVLASNPATPHLASLLAPL